MIQSISKRSGKSVDWLEAKYQEAKKLAADEGHREDYSYITGIFKRIVGESAIVSENILVSEGEYNGHSGNVHYVRRDDEFFNGFHRKKSGRVNGYSEYKNDDGTTRKLYHITPNDSNKEEHVWENNVFKTHDEAKARAQELTKPYLKSESVCEATEPFQNDKRYKISKEFTGHDSGKKQHVVRFGGDFISSHETKDAAESAAQKHKDERNYSLNLEGKEMDNKMQIDEASLTKKHMIAAAKEVAAEPDAKVRKILHDHHAKIFAAANPNFNAGRFKEACNLTEEKLEEKAAPCSKCQENHVAHVHVNDNDENDVRYAQTGHKMFEGKEMEIEEGTQKFGKFKKNSDEPRQKKNKPDYGKLRQQKRQAIEKFAEAIIDQNMEEAKGLFEQMLAITLALNIQEKREEVAEKMFGNI